MRLSLLIKSHLQRMARLDNHSVRRHTYEALKGPEYIRLMVLHPASSPKAPLRIDFTSSTLEDVEGRYDAISYTWGQPILSFALHLDNGTQICVTQNLDRVLRYLRYQDRDRVLWADAACINQTDNDEKATQIPLMVQIFRGARRVMAWLDPGRDTTTEQKGMRTMDQLSRIPQNPSIRNKSWPTDFSNVFQFLNLPWFDRLWIIQEVVFNLEIRLICGETELPFSRLIAALSLMERQNKASGLSSEDMANWNAIAAIRKLWNLHSLLLDHPDHDSKNTDILDLVEKFGGYGCSDARDRIFALYSMATNVRPTDYLSQVDGSSLGPNGYSHLPYDVVYMNIDYSLDVMETYKTFTLACMGAQGYKGPSILAALLSRQHSLRPADWPSWVPDWRVVSRKKAKVPIHLDGLVDFEFHATSTDVVRMRMSITRTSRIRWDEDSYTVTSRTLRSAGECEIPLLAQLSRMYLLLQETTPRTPDTTDLADGLINIILALVSGYESEFPDDERGAEKLRQFFAEVTKVSGVNDSLCGQTPSSTYQGLVDLLNHHLGDDTDLFCFHDSGLGVNSIGYGNVALELGDHILPVDPIADASLTAWRLQKVLIIRKTSSIEESDGKRPVYRLVGSGYMYDPLTVSLHDRFQDYRRDMEKTKHPEWYGTKEWWSIFVSRSKIRQSDHRLNLA